MTDAERVWADKPDDDILQAARDLDEFTDEGQRIIRAELRRRHLPPPEAPVGRCARCGRSIYDNTRRDRCAQCGEPYTADVRASGDESGAEVGLVRVLRTSDAGLMGFATSLLESAAIVSSVRGDRVQDFFGVGRIGGYNFVTGPAELWVRAPDEDRARALLDGLTDTPPTPADDAHAGPPRPGDAE